MKKKFVLFALLAALFSATLSHNAVAADVNGEFSVYYPGEESCATILQWRQEKHPSYPVALSWVTGFLTATGFLRQTQEQFKTVMKTEEIVELILEHCEENPQFTLSAATGGAALLLVIGAGGDISDLLEYTPQ